MWAGILKLEAMAVDEINLQDEVSNWASKDSAWVHYGPVFKMKPECNRTEVGAFRFEAELTEPGHGFWWKVVREFLQGGLIEVQ